MKASEEITIRRGTDQDIELLRLMILEAAFWRAGDASSRPPSILDDPHLRRYIAGWGRAGDALVVAQSGGSAGRPIGAAWYRLLRRPEPGYGYIDDTTPEVSIAVVSGQRGRGVGAALLSALADVARADGFAALYLSVEKDNPALRLYLRSGRVIDVIMINGRVGMHIPYELLNVAHHSSEHMRRPAEPEAPALFGHMLRPEDIPGRGTEGNSLYRYTWYSPTQSRAYAPLWLSRAISKRLK